MAATHWEARLSRSAIRSEARTDTLAAERKLLHAGGGSSAWHNLGLWPASGYAEACSTLARAVGDAAGLRAGQRVLSVACGEGDELSFWLDHYGCASSAGVDPRLAFVEHRDARIERHPCTWAQALETALRQSQRFDAIVCVDAAYHLSPRAAWLKDCAGLLKPGGHIAFTDLTLALPGAMRRAGLMALRPFFKAGAMTADDLLTPEASMQRLGEAGFCEVQQRELSQAVLDGFAAFARRQSLKLGNHARSPDWRRVRVTASALRWLRRMRPLGLRLGYALFSARLRSHSACSERAADCAELTADSSSGTPSPA